MIALIIISLMLIINVCAIRNAEDKAYHRGYEDAQNDNNNKKKETIMTREEQIIEASQLYAKYQQKPFLDGAKWADNNPKPAEIEIEFSTEEIFSKNWQERKKYYFEMVEKHIKRKLINKACEYLKLNRDNVETEDNGIMGWIPDEFIEKFRRAMEE